MTRCIRGTTSIEFALVALCLLTLTFGGIEYSRMLWTWQALQIAGDATARRVAIASPDCTTASTYAIDTAAG